MANMSYCRFQNTVVDLRDCYEHIDDEGLSAEEMGAQARLITLCRQISALFDDEADDALDEMEERIDTLNAALADSQERNRQLSAELAMLKGKMAAQSDGRIYSEGCKP